MRALATSISMHCVYLPKFIKQMHYYDPCRSTMGNFLQYYHYLFWHKIWRQFGNNVLPSFIYQPLHTSRSEDNWRVPFKIQKFARFSLGRRPSNKVIWPRNATALPTELYLITCFSSSVDSATTHIIKIKIHSSCDIEDFVETHICKLCVILRSRVSRVVCPLLHIYMYVKLPNNHS